MKIQVQNNNEILGNCPPVFSVSEHRRLHNNISDKSACFDKSYATLDSVETVTAGGRVSIAFFPQELILRILGRYPLEICQSFPGSNKIPKILSDIFRYFNWIYFLLTTAGLTFLLLVTTLGFAIFYLSWNFVEKSAQHAQELQLFNANLVPFVLVWGCLFHATVGSIALFLNRKFIAKQFQMWNDLVDLLHVPIPNSIRRFLILSNILILGFFLTIILFYCKNTVQIVPGIAKLIVLLIQKPFNSENNFIFEEAPTATVTIGLAIILYIIYASRALVLFFTFKCRLLRACFTNWNCRLRSELTYDPKSTTQDGMRDDKEKATCDKLFRDHCRLIKMIRRTDAVFAASLQSYFLSQILTMCFELYYLARTDCFTKRKEDIFAGFLLVAQTFLIFFTVCLEGAYLNDAAMEGFQILRSRGFQLIDSLEKKYLIQNLLVNYSQNIAITGGKFFTLDRPFIVRLLGAVFTYFVIILQFGSEIRGDCSFL